MSINEPIEAENEQPPGKAPFQYTLKHLLAVPVWVAVFFAVMNWLGIPAVILFLLLSAFGIELWLRPARWVRISVVWGLCLLLALAALSAGSSFKKRAIRMQCTNNLKQIGLALHEYHADYECFPPAYFADEKGRPVHSWRVLILPYLDEQHLYDRYDFSEPWNGPNNAKLAKVALPVFNCHVDHEEPSTTTSYLAVVGPETAWPGAGSRKFTDFSSKGAITLLVVETVNSGVHWMEPRDLHVVQMAPGINPAAGQGISSRHPAGVNVLMADGSIIFLHDTVSPATVTEALDMEGGGESTGMGH